MKLGSKIAAGGAATLLALTMSAGPAAAHHEGDNRPNSILCTWWPFLC